MKKKIQKLCFVASVIAVTGGYAQTTNPAPYCNGGYDDGFMPVERYISKVSIGTLSNSSGETQSPAPHYTYYNNLAAPVLVKGNNYELSVSNDGGVSIHFVAVFIDYNNNKQFDLPEECVLHQTIRRDEVTNPSVVNITIPATAVEGVTRMRVMVFEDDEFTWANEDAQALPCTDFGGGSLDWGETEDYNVNISSGATAGVDEIRDAEQYIVYPNPVRETLHIHEAWKGSSVEILDLDGRLLREYRDIRDGSVDVAGLKPGIVLVRITGEKGIFSQKLIIDPQ